MSESDDRAPSRDVIAQKLRLLVSGELTPQAASNWASPWIMKFDKIEPPIDPKVRKALVALAGADLVGDMDGTLLHGREDFEAWLRDLLG